jgi:hypothetical protein
MIGRMTNDGELTDLEIVKSILTIAGVEFSFSTGAWGKCDTIRVALGGGVFWGLAFDPGNGTFSHQWLYSATVVGFLPRT